MHHKWKETIGIVTKQPMKNHRDRLLSWWIILLKRLSKARIVSPKLLTRQALYVRMDVHSELALDRMICLLFPFAAEDLFNLFIICPVLQIHGLDKTGVGAKVHIQSSRSRSKTWSQHATFFMDTREVDTLQSSGIQSKIGILHRHSHRQPSFIKFLAYMSRAVSGFGAA